MAGIETALRNAFDGATFRRESPAKEEVSRGKQVSAVRACRVHILKEREREGGNWRKMSVPVCCLCAGTRLGYLEIKSEDPLSIGGCDCPRVPVCSARTPLT